jgi:hypothetical protein
MRRITTLMLVAVAIAAAAFAPAASASHGPPHGGVAVRAM